MSTFGAAICSPANRARLVPASRRNPQPIGQRREIRETTWRHSRSRRCVTGPLADQIRRRQKLIAQRWSPARIDVAARRICHLRYWRRPAFPRCRCPARASPFAITAMRSDSLTRNSAAPRNARRSVRRGGGDEQDRKLVDHVRHDVRPARRYRAAARDARRDRRPARRRIRAGWSRECRRPSRAAHAASRCGADSCRRRAAAAPTRHRASRRREKMPPRKNPQARRCRSRAGGCPPSSSCPTRAELDRPAERREHAFGVVARRVRLAHAGLASRVQAGQQDRGLHLRARNRQRRTRCREDVCLPRDVQRRQSASLRVNVRTHPSERLDHAPHRPARQRFVADQDGIESLPRQQSGSRRIPVPALPQSIGAGATRSPCRPTPCTMRSLAPRRFDAHAHIGERARGRARVLAFEKSGDARRTFGQRRKHDRAMRDRLVAGNAHVAAQRARWALVQSTRSSLTATRPAAAGFPRACPTLMRRHSGNP